MEKGDIFGEGCLFPDELGVHRRERASAVSIVSVYALQASALLEIAEEYPEVCLSAEVACEQDPALPVDTLKKSPQKMYFYLTLYGNFRKKFTPIKLLHSPHMPLFHL